MDVFLVTDFPTILDPNGKYAFGLTTALNINQAAIAVIGALRVTGLDINNSDSGLVILAQWDNTVPGLQLFFG